MEPVEGYGRPGVMWWLSELTRSHSTGGVFYGWRLVVIGFLIILVGREIGDGLIGPVWGSRTYQGEGIGPPWVPLVIAAYALGGLASLWFAGWGADRLGPRKMAQIGLPLAGLVALLAVIPVPGVLEVAVAGLGALGMIGAYVPAVTALNNWFRDRLALAVALMLFGAAIGAKIIGPLLTLLTLPQVVVDWRLLTVVCGAAILAAALPLVRALRDRPEDWGEHPDGLTPAPAASIPNYSWREAVRSRQLWLLIAAGCCVASAESIGAVYQWQIISRGDATFEAIDRIGMFQDYASVAGILAGGLASYRFPVRWVLSGAAVAQAVGMAVLLPGLELGLLEVAVLRGLASGMGTAPTIAAVGIYFGRRSFGMLTVMTFIITFVASSAALPSSGYLSYLDAAAGVYISIFMAAAIVSLVGAGLYVMLGQPRLSPAQRAEEPAISC
ncbi:MAG: MFS transporter [Chloroflexi bacterium]|nr:MFS transporter [Chloroflexota bacterium]